MVTDVITDRQLKGHITGNWNLPKTTVVVYEWLTGCYKKVKAKDTFIDNLLGTTWESRLSKAHFEIVHEAEKERRRQEDEKYILSREINPTEL